VKRCRKGQYGYRNYHRKTELGKVLAGAALILIQLLGRAMADSSSWKNILTVTAILSVLPVANWASPLLASWKYKTLPEELYKKASSHEGKCSMLYDLIITSRDAIIPVDVAAVHPTGVYAYCTAKKFNTGKAECFFKDMFLGNQLKLDVRLILDEKEFINCLSSLKPEAEYKDDGSVERGIKLLKSLSM
jgi:hypothetical protein